MNYKTTCYKGSDLPSSYKSFARRMIKKIDSELVNGKVEKASVGFYYFSLFFTLNGQLYYACSGDARSHARLQMYYRTAKHLTDYTGGVNMDFDINKVKELK